jgi:hypothetical protein
MAPNIDPVLWTDVFEVLASVATAAPMLEAPLKGSIKALKQIRQHTEVSGFDSLTDHLSMSMCNYDIQRVRNNKEDSIALANHARETTFKLVDALQAKDDRDSLKPSIEAYYK